MTGTDEATTQPQTRAATMISIELAAALKAGGLVWHPASGDRFTLTTGAFDGEVFALSDMVVEAHEFPSGTVLGFNGTTEWALDSAQVTDALWLPREDQLRELLGLPFRALERRDDGYRVTAVLPGEEAGTAFDAAEPAEAYGRALLALIRRATE
ncbi:MAG TPA: pilus assembly protein CpaE [Nakamurella sp.]|nr:pilus assembly protein CpaE [Nakamurella sp.]